MIDHCLVAGGHKTDDDDSQRLLTDLPLNATFPLMMKCRTIAAPRFLSKTLMVL